MPLLRWGMAQRRADPISTDKFASWLVGLALAAAALLAYHNSFAVPFLFDDNSSIRDNPTIRSLLRAWWPPADGGFTVSGRPVVNFSLALNYAASGTAVWSYHVLNLVIHVLAGCTLFGVVRHTLRLPACRKLFAGGAGQTESERAARDARAIACCVALIWTLHPLQTESVTYIIQRAESLVSLFYLLTLWAFIRAAEPGAGTGWRWGAFLACAFGMATKEVMVTAPVLVVLYDRVFLAVSWRDVWERRGRQHLALAGTWLVLAALMLATRNRGGTAGLGTSVSPAAYALTQIGAIGDYLRLACWPWPLIFDYGQFQVSRVGEILRPALVVLPLAAASLYALWRRWPAGYGGFFFFGVLAPTSSFVPVVTQTMNEHRTYLALAALVTLAVTATYALAGRRSLVVFLVIAPVLGLVTERRNRDYRSEQGLWEDTAAKRPGNARAYAALGAIHLREGRLEAARAALQETVRVAPDSGEMRNNLGNVWMKLGRFAEAAQCFQEALVRQPGDPFILNNLGNTYLQLGRGPEAIVALAAAVRAKPDLHEARYNLANTLAQAGRLPEAADNYAALLAARPGDAEARSNYGEVLMEMGRGPEAIAQFEAAVRLKPDSAVLHNNLGAALARIGHPAEALKQFQAAVRLDPHFTEARENAARAARLLEGN